MCVCVGRPSHTQWTTGPCRTCPARYIMQHYVTYNELHMQSCSALVIRICQPLFKTVPCFWVVLRESSPDDVHRTRRFTHLQKKEAFPRSLVCKPAITAPTDSTSTLQKATRSWQRQVRCDTAQTTFRHRARESQHSWLAEASCWHLAGVTSLQCYHRRYSVCVRHSQKKRKKPCTNLWTN